MILAVFTLFLHHSSYQFDNGNLLLSISATLKGHAEAGKSTSLQKFAPIGIFAVTLAHTRL
jgi:hypothetical protein